MEEAKEYVADSAATPSAPWMRLSLPSMRLSRKVVVVASLSARSFDEVVAAVVTASASAGYAAACGEGERKGKGGGEEAARGGVSERRGGACKRRVALSILATLAGGK